MMMMMMMMLLILLLCTIVNVLAIHPAVTMYDICKADDDVCVTDATRKLFPLVLEANESIGVENMDPLFQEKMEGNLFILKYTLFNTTITGLKSCEIPVARFLDKRRKTLHIEMLCPKVAMEGIYDAKGHLLTLSVEGHGDYKIQTGKYSIIIDFEVKTVTKDEKNYKSIKSFKFKGEPLERVTFDFKNLFNGRKDLADIVLKFANENWKELVYLLQDEIFQADFKRLEKNINQNLKTVSIEES